MSTSVKSRQIRDLKLEIELRDGRIHELEEAYEELERKAEFARGEVECRLTDQQREMEEMAAKQAALHQVIDAQSQQLTEVTTTLEQYKSMQSMMAALMQRCKELEDTQRAQEEAQRQAKLDAERAAAAAAALKAEEERCDKEREAAAAAKRAEEEAEAARIVAEQVHRHSALTAATSQSQESCAQQGITTAARPAALQRFRPQTAPSRQPVTGKRECSVM